MRLLEAWRWGMGRVSAVRIGSRTRGDSRLVWLGLLWNITRGNGLGDSGYGLFAIEAKGRCCNLGLKTCGATLSLRGVRGALIVETYRWSKRSISAEVQTLCEVWVFSGWCGMACGNRAGIRDSLQEFGRENAAALLGRIRSFRVISNVFRSSQGAGRAV